MLHITVKGGEVFDNDTQEFSFLKPQVLTLEHSLISVSKWEGIHHVPFLRKEPMSDSEMISYIECMTVSKNVDPLVYKFLSEDNLIKIQEYIDNPMTATTFNNMQDDTTSREIITSELIYYWMITAQIPLECEKWHLNRLFTLLRVAAIKNGPTKKMGKQEIYRRNRELNEARKKKLKTKG